MKHSGSLSRADQFLLLGFQWSPAFTKFLQKKHGVVTCAFTNIQNVYCMYILFVVGKSVKIALVTIKPFIEVICLFDIDKILIPLLFRKLMWKTGQAR